MLHKPALTMNLQQEKQYDYLLKLILRVPKSEIQLQSKCAELLYWFYPNDWQRLVCVNNNDSRANTSNIGIVPGASDTYWIAQNGKTIYIEFKFGDNRQSKQQMLWEALISRYGHDYRIVYSEDAFWYLTGFKQPVKADILNLHWFASAASAQQFFK